MRSGLLLVAAGLLILGGAAISHAAKKGDREPEVLPGNADVVICHASGNTFTRNSVDVNSIVKGTGHGAHVNDIIPPFFFRLSPTEAVQHYPGRNWDEGEAIWTNGCSRPTPPSGTIEVFGCVDVHGATFDATFGYNRQGGSVTISTGPSNEFSPAPVDRGQVTTFSDGHVLHAFMVRDITEPELTWTVKHAQSDSVTVSRSSPPCESPQEPEPLPAIPIGVFVACVTNHGSSFDAVFGYESENLGTQTIPIGPANHFSPGEGNRGQPTTFMPGKSREAVKVTGIPNSAALTWTLALIDTRTATATADFDIKCGEPPSPEPFGIFATCVTRHGSTYDAVFGYVNENVHTLHIPIGERNSIRPGPADQGQPDSFPPGFVDAAFAVTAIPASRSVTWRIELDHEARVAVATASLSDCLTDPISPIPDAAISKSVAPGTGVVGQRVTATITVRNRGNAVLRPAEVKDVIRGVRLRMRSVTATRGRCRAAASGRAQTVRCRAGTLAPGGSLKIRIAATPMAFGASRDQAAIVSVGGDPTPRNNQARAEVHIVRPPPGLGLG